MGAPIWRPPYGSSHVGEDCAWFARGFRVDSVDLARHPLVLGTRSLEGLCTSVPSAPKSGTFSNSVRRCECIWRRHTPADVEKHKAKSMHVVCTWTVCKTKLILHSFVARDNRQVDLGVDRPRGRKLASSWVYDPARGSQTHRIAKKPAVPDNLTRGPHKGGGPAALSRGFLSGLPHL